MSIKVTNKEDCGSASAVGAGTDLCRRCACHQLACSSCELQLGGDVSGADGMGLVGMTAGSKCCCGVKVVAAV